VFDYAASAEIVYISYEAGPCLRIGNSQLKWSVEAVFSETISFGDSGLLECDAVLLGEWFTTFRKIVVPLSSATNSPVLLDCLILTMKALRSFETSGTTHSTISFDIDAPISVPSSQQCSVVTLCNLAQENVWLEGRPTLGNTCNIRLYAT
jgi:hypothetical protein